MEYLEKYNKMKFAIQECHKIDEIKLIRDKAEAYRYAMIQAKESPELIRKAEEIKLRAERRAGELLPEQIRKSEEGRPKEAFQGRTLTDMNIERKQSSNWQRIASIPEDKFEEYINTEKEITTSGAVKLAKGLKRKEEIEDIKDKIINENKQIKDKYDVVILDPPWQYGRKYNSQGSRVASPYPEQNKEEIYNTCKDFYKDDCVLWLWTTHTFIWQAKELMDMFGFTYKATIVWDKEKIGIGSWLRMQCEFCLLGIKGKPYFKNTTEIDIIREKRREHSRKPVKFYELVKKVCYGNIFEYYSREEKAGIITEGVENDKLAK